MQNIATLLKSQQCDIYKLGDTRGLFAPEIAPPEGKKIFKVQVCAPRAACPVADVHSGRCNRNFVTGNGRASFLQRQPRPGFQDNTFIQYTIQQADQVIRVGDKWVHFNLSMSDAQTRLRGSIWQTTGDESACSPASAALFLPRASTS